MSLMKWQKPLYQSVIVSVSPSEQKLMLGKRLFRLIQATHPHQAGKITGMLLEIDNTELLHMLASFVRPWMPKLSVTEPLL